MAKAIICKKLDFKANTNEVGVCYMF